MSLLYSWLVNRPLPDVPSKKPRVFFAGLLKGNQWVFISPDRKGPRRFLGGVAFGWGWLTSHPSQEYGLSLLAEVGWQGADDVVGQGSVCDML